MKTILNILLSILTLTLAAKVPKDIINQNYYDSGWFDVTEDMLLTNDAMYFLGTQTTDDGNRNYDFNIVLIKTELNGDLIWQKTLGGSAADHPNSIIKDSEGNIYIGAGTYSKDGDSQSGIMGGKDAWVIKMDPTGNIIWEKTFGGSKDDFGVNLLYLENGNVLMYMRTLSNDYDVAINYGYLDIWMAEMTTDGDIVNSKVFGSSANENIFSLIQSGDGGFFTAAHAGTNDGVVEAASEGWQDVWLLKLDAHLNIEWQKMIGGTNMDAGGLGLAEIEGGGYIINGTTKSADGDMNGFDCHDQYNQNDIWVVRLDSEGNIIWDIALGGDHDETTSKLFPNDDGSFTVFGSTKSIIEGDESEEKTILYNPNTKNDDIWMMHLSENGELLDQKFFGNASAASIFRGIIKKTDHHYLLAGSAYAKQVDPDKPEAFTEVQLRGGNTSTSQDIWFFEIVDCEYFQPEVPAGIEGLDLICTLNTNSSTYKTRIANPQYEDAHWQIQPSEAGELTMQQNTAIIKWNSDFVGKVQLRVRSKSNCGESEYSEPKIIEVRATLGIGKTD